MSIIKVIDIAYVRFSAPDLDRMRAFLLDFGLRESGDNSPDILRMRGSGDAPFIHVTEKGESTFRGIGLYAESLEALDDIAIAAGAEKRPIDAPGGGWMVRLVDPDGFEVDVVAGQARAAQLVPDPTPWNDAREHRRTGLPKRLPPGPSNVVRLGHAVMLVADLAQSWRWWSEHFGLLVSDEVRDPDGQSIALFIRCDRGSIPTDHHTLNFAQAPAGVAQFHHAAFEVADLDSLMTGHDHLAGAGHGHMWGVGRHILGSQVFDYWQDPFGNKIEHWTDGDLLSAEAGSSVQDIAAMIGGQWGPAIPEGFV